MFYAVQNDEFQKLAVKINTNTIGATTTDAIQEAQEAFKTTMLTQKSEIKSDIRRRSGI